MVSGTSILIVDDDKNQCDLYALMLRTLSWSVTTVSSSQEAWKLLLDHPPVLILSDVLMPGLSGLDLLHRIRDDEHLRVMKVILMTVVPEQIDTADAALADKVLSKPFMRAALKSAVQDVLHSSR